MNLALKLSFAVALSLTAACTASSPADNVDESASMSDELSGGLPVGTQLVTTAALNLRSGPSTSKAVIDVMSPGSTVKTLDAQPVGGFYHVSFQGTSGYASGAYLAKTGGSSGGGGGGNSGGGSAVTRAMSWVSAQVPYCGGTNGGHDAICGGTCYRPHETWDNYRSDCSGLVSYAWGLAAPGQTTGGFAPYDTSVSYVIQASDLGPGDAVNVNEGGQHHIMLFWHWINRSTGTAAFIEEGNCGQVAKTASFNFSISGSRLNFSDGRHFYAIRHR